MENIRANLQRLIWVRLVAATGAASIVLVGALSDQQQPFVPSAGWFLWGMLAAGYLLSFFYWWWARNSDRLGNQAYVQLAFDTGLVTMLVVHYGVRTAFSVLYFPIVVAAAWMVSRRAAFHLATFAWASYAVAVTGLYKGWWISQTPDSNPDSLVFLVVYKILTHCLGLYAVALLASNLIGRTEAVASQLAHSERRYQRLENLYRNVFESIDSGVITTDLQGGVTSVNRAACALFAIPNPVAAPSRSFSDRFPSQVSALLASRNSEREEIEVEIGGRHFALDIIIRPLTSQNQEIGRCMTIVDVTEERRLASELQLQERMATAGELAAGLAHEIGNPLAAIAGSAQLLRETESSPSELRLLQVIGRESQRLDRTVKDFLSFARRPEVDRTTFDLTALVRECSELLTHSVDFGTQHQVQLNNLDQPQILAADCDQVTQIFWNLTQNALRAMPDGGTMEISVEANDSWVTLAVRDHGVGIDSKQLANLVSPFQSQFRAGAGIGLAIVYRIAEAHRGHLRIGPAKGGGTLATVEFPNLEETGPEEASPRESQT